MSSAAYAQSSPPTQAPSTEDKPAETPADAPPADAPSAEPRPEAQGPQGTVTGRVIDKATNEGMPAATISIQGASGDQTLATDLDGTFTLKLAPGEYTIDFETPEYVGQTRKVVVVADKAQNLDLALELVQQKAKEETIEVYDVIDTRKDSALLAERRFAPTVSDAIGQQQIARSPDSNAGDAAKRMVGATIQDNKYLVVRGLGGRYSLTLLNGVPLPSPDPDMPSAPLDLFPASLITNLTVNKTFSPDLPASFAGGALSIETRTYPTKFTFKARVGVADNSQASFQNLNGQNGGNLDFLGYASGDRGLPSSVPRHTLAGSSQLTTEQRAEQASGFKSNWELEKGTVGPNLGLGATLGDTVKIADQRVGYTAAVSYGHGYAERKAHISRVGETDGNGGHLASPMQLEDTAGIETATLGAIGSAGWSPKRGHKIDAFAMYASSTDITSSDVLGTENNGSDVERTRMQFLQRTLLFSQLLGEHKLSDNAILEWQGTASHTGQSEPDTRDLLRTSTGDGSYAIAGGAGTAERLFGTLGENTFGGQTAVRVPLEQVKLKFGAGISHSERDYQVRRFHFDVTGDARTMEPNDAFDPDTAGTSMSMTEMTMPTDGYKATRTIGNAYAMADISATKDLRFVAGARFEASRLGVGLESDLRGLTANMPRTNHDDNDVLPSLNMVYAVLPNSNLRLAYGMTVARPNFREIAPALYYDYVRRRAIGGNPDLQETKIHNGDLRWETFLGENEVLAASVFYKYFDSPIERTVEDAGDGQNIGFTNTDHAQTYGAELEARISLGRLSDALGEFSVGGNLSLIKSSNDIGGGHTRALQGQSPYVANVGLGYESNATQTRVDLLYNSFGHR
ncbi:MAG TPA: TonB-dependent receptor, partial [Kofleriaceae bacterium]